MKAEDLAEKLENRSRFGYETQEQANKRHILACKAAAAELRRLAALEQAAEPVPAVQKLPFGYRLIAVKNFDALLTALDRAESKGYMPDAMKDEWESFEYSQVDGQDKSSGVCAVCVLGISGDCYCGQAAPQPAQQAAEPVAVFKEDKSFGHVEFIPFQGPPLKEGDKLYTHPARKPMKREDMRKLLAEHFRSYDLTGADFSLIRAVERFHQIEGQP